jgi:hypothetical protein
MFTYLDRPLEYFKPLNEWVDVIEVRAGIPAGAAGQSEIPLGFQPYDREVWWTRDYFGFHPYTLEYPCNEDLWPDGGFWEYDVEYHGGFVRVLGDQKPQVPDLGIRIHLEDAAAPPGGIAEVALLASSEHPLHRLRLALEVDLDAVEAVDLEFEAGRAFTGETSSHTIARGESFSTHECVDRDGDGAIDECGFGVPASIQFHETEERYVLIDYSTGSADNPGPELNEIGRLRVRIREETTATVTVVRAARFPADLGTLEEVESGGTPRPLDDAIPFAPAREVAGGAITILSEQLVRGDANVDGLVDIGDAAATLRYLFSGGEAPGCMDAADADDSGIVDITDPIFLLGVLFFGHGALPPPYPDCGSDPTRDDLRCAASC